MLAARSIQLGLASTASPSLLSDPAFVTDLALSPNALAAATTAGAVKLLDPESLRVASALTLPETARDGAGVTALQWCDVLLYAASSTAVHAFDARARTSEPSTSWALARAGSPTVGAMAVSACGSLLAAGIGPEVAFFDVRSSSSSGAPRTLGVYRDCHSDDVTQLTFHPTLPAHVLSGGEDGLVCVADSRVRGEADAIRSVLSVGSSLARFGVFGPHGAFAHAVSRTGTLSLWNLATAERLGAFPDLKLQAAEAGLRGVDFLVTCHHDERTDALTLLAGGHGGELHAFSATPEALSHRGAFAGGTAGHAAPVRCAVWSSTATGEAGSEGTLFTGGEDGRVVQWRSAGAGAVAESGARKNSHVIRRAPRADLGGDAAALFSSRALTAAEGGLGDGAGEEEEEEEEGGEEEGGEGGGAAMAAMELTSAEAAGGGLRAETGAARIARKRRLRGLRRFGFGASFRF